MPSTAKLKVPQPPRLKATVLGFCAACNDYVEADLDTLRCLQCRQTILFVPLQQTK